MSKLISLYKDCPDPADFDFAMAICIWKHIEAFKSGRKVTVASPFRRFVHFPNPSILPTPGKRTVNSFQKVLIARKERQTKKAKIREKINKNIGNLDTPVESIINVLEDDEEIDQDNYEIDDLIEHLDNFPGGHLSLLQQPGGDVLDAEAVACGSVVSARGRSDSDRETLFFDFGDQFIV